MIWSVKPERAIELRNLAKTTFGAVFQNEVLLNSRRIAPYALIILFSATAVMGWSKGPAVALGWATNSDFYIARSLKAFSFLFGLPLFNAVIMGDSVIRDFRLGIDPLIFSKSVSRAQYLFGKFFGSFFVLVCCSAAFPLTLLLLQAFRPSQMVIQQVQVLPYFKHFFFFVVITHLMLAAFYFTVGTLTRNSKIVYGLAISFYPIYISAMLFLLAGLPVRWRNFFDAFLLNSGPSNNGFGNSADFLNSYVMSYTPDMIGNRVLLILIATICLTVLYVRFRVTERPGSLEKSSLMLGLSTAGDQESSLPGFKESTIRRRVQASYYYFRRLLFSLGQSIRARKLKMRNLGWAPFAAIFQNEVLLNSRRVAPYVLMLFSIFNAVLWSLGQGSSYYGQELLAKYGTLWAINSDYYISHHFGGYALGIFGLPLFAALIMAEPVRRDFRLEIDALIFSKPISRAQYLLGKFFGSFFVLVCCQASFAATLILLQVVHPSQTVVLPFTLLPYFKHFIMIVVITYALFAAVYFTVGTLTRNPKIVYGLAIAYYPLIFSYGIFFLQNLPPRWRVLLSPLMLREMQIQPWGRSPEWVDRLVVSYTPIMFANRALVILAAAVCLTIVYLRFRITEPPAKPEKFSWLNLSAGSEVLYFDPPILQPTPGHPASDVGSVRVERAEAKESAVPSVISANAGLRANLAKLAAALGIEFRLLRAERSLVVIIPLAIFLSILEVAFYNIPPDVSHSAAYATNTAKLLLLFLIGMTVFYTGEAIHRDRELRIEPVLWTMPAPNNVLLLSKFFAVLSLTACLIVLVGLAAIIIQLLRGHTPVDISPYLITYSVILLPSIVFTTGASIALNILLRDKYVVYALSIGTAAGLLYLYNQGYNHWLYNPVLYQLWTYADLTGGGSNQATILVHRIYCLAIAGTCLSLAHLFFQRKSTTRLFVNRHPSNRGLSFLIALVSLTIAFVSAVMIVK